MAQPAESGSPDGIGHRIFGVALTLAALCAIGWGLWLGLFHPYRGPARTRIGDVTLAHELGKRCGEQDLLAITVVHSPDKSDWLQRGAEGFMRRCTNIQVRLVPMSDFAALDAFAHHDLEPDLWIPTSELFVEMLEDEVVHERGPDLLHSPLVVLAQSDRLDALAELEPELFERDDAWARLACLLPPDVDLDEAIELSGKQPWTWLAWWMHDRPEDPPHQPVGDATREHLRGWGRVDFVHSSPSTDSAGLAVLVLMAHGYLGEVAASESFELGIESRRELLQAWLHRCEAGQDEPIESGRVLAQRMHQLGPAGFDGVFTYEQRALEVLGQLSDREDDLAALKLVMPSTTVVSDHPAVYLPWPETAAEHAQGLAREQSAQLVMVRDARAAYHRLRDARRLEDAAVKHGATKLLVDFLLESPMQESAIAYGFRPGRADVDIRLARLDANPFIDLRRLGAAIELDVGEPPSLTREPLRDLLDIWQDATGRQ